MLVPTLTQLRNSAVCHAPFSRADVNLVVVHFNSDAASLPRCHSRFHREERSRIHSFDYSFQASELVKQLRTLPKPENGDYDTMFDVISNNIIDERVFVSDRQKNLLHMNGVMPAEYANGFPTASAMHNFIDAKMEQSRGFSEQFVGARPADGTFTVHLLPSLFKRLATRGASGPRI